MSTMLKTEWIALFVLTAFTASGQSAADRKDWVPIFNGRNLDGWTVKLAHHDVGDNYGDTFRVDHPDYAMISPVETDVTIYDRDGHLRVVSLDLIVTLEPVREQAKKAGKR